MRDTQEGVYSECTSYSWYNLGGQSGSTACTIGDEAAHSWEVFVGQGAGAPGDHHYLVTTDNPSATALYAHDSSAVDDNIADGKLLDAVLHGPHGGLGLPLHRRRDGLNEAPPFGAQPIDNGVGAGRRGGVKAPPGGAEGVRRPPDRRSERGLPRQGRRATPGREAEAREPRVALAVHRQSPVGRRRQRRVALGDPAPARRAQDARRPRLPHGRRAAERLPARASPVAPRGGGSGARDSEIAVEELGEDEARDLARAELAGGAHAQAEEELA